MRTSVMHPPSSLLYLGICYDMRTSVIRSYTHHSQHEVVMNLYRGIATFLSHQLRRERRMFDLMHMDILLSHFLLFSIL